MTIAVSNAEFLEAMFADLPDEAAAMLAGFRGDPGEPPEYAWAARPWQWGDALPWRISHESNNYVAVGSFRRDASGKYRRRHDCFARLHAVMVDDVGTKVAQQKVRLAPSALVETSPGNFQGWYFLRACDGTDDATQARALIDALVDSGLATDSKDPGMAGANRYGRLPVGVNGKRRVVAAVGRPFACRIAEWAPERVYSVDELRAAYGLVGGTKPAQRPAVVPARIAACRVEAFADLFALVVASGHYQHAVGDGRHAILCPWYFEHSEPQATGAALFEPSAANGGAGGFRCHHGVCGGSVVGSATGKRRSIADVYRWARAFRREVRAA